MREPWSYCFPQLSLLCRPALFLKLYMAKTKIITRETSGTHDILVTGWVAELSHSDTSFSSVITFKWSESLSSQSQSGAGGMGWWGAWRPITPGQQVGTSGTSGVSRDVSISMETAKLQLEYMFAGISRLSALFLSAEKACVVARLGSLCKTLCKNCIHSR